AARRLERADAASLQRGMVFAEDEPFHALVVAGIADRSDVGFAGLAGEHGLFRAPYRLEHRRLATLVAIDADAEVHFPRVPVRAKRGHQTENGIVGHPLETF